MSRRTLALVAALVCAAVAGCGAGAAGPAAPTTTVAARIVKDPAHAQTTITVGSKNFTEQKVLGQIYAQALAAAGYVVRTELSLGDEKAALRALQDGRIDAYPEYTGTALLSFFDVPTGRLPMDPARAYADVKADFARQGIAALAPTPFTSSNEVALTQERAQHLGVTTISDLRDRAPSLTLYGTPECRRRMDCLLGLRRVYGLRFEKFVAVGPALRHEVLEKGRADVSIVFTTDPQNKRDNLVLLEDDRGMFPPYNSTFLVKQAFLDRTGPDLRRTVELVNRGLTAGNMQELNARVDLDKKTPAQVAREYLQEQGYIG